MGGRVWVWDMRSVYLEEEQSLQKYVLYTTKRGNDGENDGY